ncbi:MAG: hypothetical protein JRD93_10730 [Deltaproteobacteria bacterium]|nr:hypothetical protein [Deltaproteobacteria bacterium]MBW2662441.1 hypothetical protein [Deltaproteobacteria bacterium]
MANSQQGTLVKNELDTGHDQPLTPVGVWAPEYGQALQLFKDIEIKPKGHGSAKL